MPASKVQSNVFVEIWNSFRATPGWVQVWMVFLLIPINMASLFFINEPKGMLIAFLANIGMLLNIPVMFYDRGAHVYTTFASVDCVGAIDYIS